MSLVIPAERVPLEEGIDHIIRVGGTRVTLDTIVTAYQQGESPETIADQYPSVSLPDIFAVIGFYLRHRQEVETYSGGPKATARTRCGGSRGDMSSGGVAGSVVGAAWFSSRTAETLCFDSSPTRISTITLCEGFFVAMRGWILSAFRTWGLAGQEDPAVLAWAAAAGRLLLTHDTGTVPGFADQRVAQGKPTPGVVVAPRQVAIGQAIDAILLLAECSHEGEWEGKTVFLPL